MIFNLKFNESEIHLHEYKEVSLYCHHAWTSSVNVINVVFVLPSSLLSNSLLFFSFFFFSLSLPVIPSLGWLLFPSSFTVHLVLMTAPLNPLPLSSHMDHPGFLASLCSNPSLMFSPCCSPIQEYVVFSVSHVRTELLSLAFYVFLITTKLYIFIYIYYIYISELVPQSIIWAQFLYSCL